MTLEGHTDSLYGLSFSPNGKLLCSGSFDKLIKIWNLEDGKEVRSLAGHTNVI